MVGNQVSRARTSSRGQQNTQMWFEDRYQGRDRRQIEGRTGGRDRRQIEGRSVGRDRRQIEARNGGSRGQRERETGIDARYCRGSREQGGRILQIHVHRHHIVPVRVLKSRVHGRLFSEISRKGHHMHPLILLMDFFDFFHSPVPGAVIHINDLIIQPFFFKKIFILYKLRIKVSDSLFLIVARYDHTQ